MVRAAVLPAVSAPLDVTSIALPEPGPGQVRVRGPHPDGVLAVPAGRWGRGPSPGARPGPHHVACRPDRGRG
ncbi:hypothetical protein HMPREF1486_01118 [Streptomyces sp. HPH0547]|uniref:Uncharacterized protein n=1 Tax=Streptomyces albus TaxID=1888 RepID=A0A8H1QQZ1_9ACTN|nr:hypothetical protein HMPREF1486_01118 [Streptomyces sp. HPH0547]TGG78806.1 hypothetical protein D8771_24180 [Streptomyces albus]